MIQRRSPLNVDYKDGLEAHDDNDYNCMEKIRRTEINDPIKYAEKEPRQLKLLTANKTIQE